MKIENVELKIQRVERVSKVYGPKGEVIQETWEYFFPEEIQNKIGYKPPKK